MNGIPPSCSILRILTVNPYVTKEKNIEQDRDTQVIAIEKIQADLPTVHKDVDCSVYLRIERSIAAHNKATNIITPSLEVGHLVHVRGSNE